MGLRRIFVSLERSFVSNILRLFRLVFEEKIYEKNGGHIFFCSHTVQTTKTRLDVAQFIIYCYYCLLLLLLLFIIILLFIHSLLFTVCFSNLEDSGGIPLPVFLFRANLKLHVSVTPRWLERS